MVWAEQAVFTSLQRHGRGGYHLVSRSQGIGGQDAQALSSWSPSHGALHVDPHNQVSVNLHPLPSGRLALSRTCEGPPEYSGRGGRQLYTHILVLEDRALRAAGGQPFSLYRNALALGYLLYHPNPPTVLEPIRLPTFFIPRTSKEWLKLAFDLRLPNLEPLRDRLAAGKPVRVAYAGDRMVLAECLIGSLPEEAARRVSFATSLEPSSVRPYLLTLIGTGPRPQASRPA